MGNAFDKQSKSSTSQGEKSKTCRHACGCDKAHQDSIDNKNLIPENNNNNNDSTMSTSKESKAGSVPESSIISGESAVIKDGTSSMIVLHSDAPSDTFAASSTTATGQNGLSEQNGELKKLAEATIDSTQESTEKETPENIEASKTTPLTLEFSIANQKLKLDDAESVTKYVDHIKANPKLRIVCLNGNTLGVGAAKALAKALETLDELEELYVNDCFTGRMKEEVHVAVEEINMALKGKCSLKIIDFSDNAFGPIGAQAAAILISERTSLEQIIINNCGLGPEGGKIIARSLMERLNNGVDGKSSSLRVIQMGRNRLENGSAPDLAQAFSVHGNLEEISIPQCGIRAQGIQDLSKGFAKCGNLTKLNLQDNTFTEEALRCFADALQSLPKLRHLDVGDCLLGNGGCVAIVDALVASGACKILETLNLQYGEMDEAGAEHLKQVLPQFKSLMVLMLNGNAFDPNGRAAMGIKEFLQLEERVEILDSWSDMEYEEEEEESDTDEEADETGSTTESNAKQPSSTTAQEDKELAKELDTLKI